MSPEVRASFGVHRQMAPGSTEQAPHRTTRCQGTEELGLDDEHAASFAEFGRDSWACRLVGRSLPQIGNKVLRDDFVNWLYLSQSGEPGCDPYRDRSLTTRFEFARADWSGVVSRTSKGSEQLIRKPCEPQAFRDLAPYAFVYAYEARAQRRQRQLWLDPEHVT